MPSATTPPGHCGYLNLGSSVDYSLAAAECAQRVIMEINNQVPHTHGETVLHARQVEAFIETSHPLAGYPPEVTAVPRAIASRVASLIPDGATIQTGIGAAAGRAGVPARPARTWESTAN
jgi:acyl-CoA hydrolase